MSSHIAFRLHAVHHSHATLKPHIPEGYSLFGDDHYVLVEEGGSSNVFDANDRVVRDWYGVASGATWEAMQEVVRVSASCEGGSLKLRGKWIKPEGYIGAWRAAIKAANEGGSAIRTPHNPRGRIKLYDDCAAVLPDHARRRLTLLEGRFNARGRDSDGREHTTWTFALTDPGQYVVFQLTKDLARYDSNGGFTQALMGWQQIN